MEGVDIVDVLLALVHLALDPMPVQVAEEMVDVFGRRRVAFPLADVERQQGLVGMRRRLLTDAPEVLLQVTDQAVVQLLADEVR